MKQQYDKYTTEDHQVWSILYKKQIEVLASRATSEFLEGIKRVGFEKDRLPRFTSVNEYLKDLTGFQVYEVPGIVADDKFFELMADKKFPATTWIRKMKDLEYIEEPDMFHDVFGHVPILSNQHFCDFLQGLSKIALNHIDNAHAVELMSRIYWFTVEFGLIREGGQLKIYGAGILSSIGESKYSLESDEPERFDYDIVTILRSSFIKEKFQEKYFIIESYEQLFNSLPEIEQLLKRELVKAA